MTDRKLVIAQLSDGKLVAASTSSPYFCTVGDSVEAVRKRANEAAQFYLSSVSVASPVAVAPRVKQLEHVTPYHVDAWLADVGMNAA